MSHQVRLDRVEEWFIRCKARQLAGKAGFTASDVDDIAQDICADVLQRLPQHDPEKSNRHSFVVMLVRRCAAAILIARRRPKRNSGQLLQSLHSTIHDGEGHAVALGDNLANDARRRRRDDAALWALRTDVRAVIARLPEHLRPWCAAFGRVSIRGLSRQHHLSRDRLQAIRDEIRAAFEDAGLADYLAEI